jgi:hypothetical protein
MSYPRNKNLENFFFESIPQNSNGMCRNSDMFNSQPLLLDLLAVNSIDGGRANLFRMLSRISSLGMLEVARDYTVMNKKDGNSHLVVIFLSADPYI